MVRLAVEQITVPSNKRLCKCGCCGEWIDIVDKYGHERFYKKGHQNIGKTPLKGRKFSEEWKTNISKSKKGKPSHRCGEKNVKWKGDDVGYFGRHRRIKKELPKPEFCQICKIRQVRHLSNISGKYLLDLSDWQWVCILCHNRFDLARTGRKVREDRKCCECNSNKTDVDLKGYTSWYVVNRELNMFRCRLCYQQNRREQKRNRNGLTVKKKSKFELNALTSCLILNNNNDFS